VRPYAVVCISSALLLVSCGGAPSQPAPSGTLTTAAATTASTATAAPMPAATAAPTAAAVVIEMGDHYFDPAQLTVKVGTTVTWKNVGQATHDLAARDGSFTNPGMSSGQSYSFVLTKPGRYPYVCMQHEGDGMVGELTVID
jgi:plastocyanin